MKYYLESLAGYAFPVIAYWIMKAWGFAPTDAILGAIAAQLSAIWVAALKQRSAHNG